MLAAAAVLLDSADSAAVAVVAPVVPEAVVVPVVAVPVPHQPLLLNLLSLPLPQVAVESEVHPRLQGRQSF
jgi:hypothetical protein